MKKRKCVAHFAAACASAFFQITQTFSKPHAFAVAPKISRGENYLGLPWLVLDYPRLFHKNGVFAVRSFMWWGRFFSSTLHLSGIYKTAFQECIINNIQTFSKAHICVSANEWQHHFEKDNYSAIESMEHGVLKKLLQSMPHIKIAAALPISQWQNAPEFFMQHWRLYMDALLSCPAGETVLSPDNPTTYFGL